MSNLLNKSKKKGNLNERGPAIVPVDSFTMDDLAPKKDKKLLRKSDTQKAAQLEKKVTSVRVKKSTRDKLNALVNLNKADTIDELIENMINEYLETNIMKDEKKQYDMIVELFRNKN